MARALFQNVDCDFEALVDFIAAREGYSADAAMAQITTAMMRKHVRRAVPEASVVLPRIQAVQAYYSLVVDEQRQLPLFTTGAYDFVSHHLALSTLCFPDMDRVFAANLKHVENECLTDPHGMLMYRKVGQITHGGRVLPVWATVRSNSQLEVRIALFASSMALNRSASSRASTWSR